MKTITCNLDFNTLSHSGFRFAKPLSFHFPSCPFTQFPSVPSISLHFPSPPFLSLCFLLLPFDYVLLLPSSHFVPLASTQFPSFPHISFHQLGQLQASPASSASRFAKDAHDGGDAGDVSLEMLRMQKLTRGELTPKHSPHIIEVNLRKGNVLESPRGMWPTPPPPQ